jgi:DNA-binding response OmpR family regulator
MGKTVLIVEDEPELLALMASAFRKADVEVYTAGNGEVAMELFHAVHPDLVITDIVMPAKEGVSLIMDIKKRPADTPVIAISGGGVRNRDYLRWAKELGAALVLQKPFRMSVLLMMARFLMEKAAAHAGPLAGPLAAPMAAPTPASALAAAAAAVAASGDPFDDLFEPPAGASPFKPYRP